MREKQLLEFVKSLKDVESILINTKNVVLDPRVRFQCQFSGCGEYGRNLMCPPNVPTIEEFERVLNTYTKGLLMVLEGDLDDKEDVKKQSDEYALKLHKIVYKTEKKAFELGYPFAAGLIGGSCKLCASCPPHIRECRHKNIARPSMEAMGINVLETGKKAGLSLDFEKGKVKWTGLVLLE